MQDRFYTEAFEKIKDSIEKLKKIDDTTSHKILVSELTLDTKTFFEKKSNRTLMEFGKLIHDCESSIALYKRKIRQLDPAICEEIKKFSSILDQFYQELADVNPKKLSDETIRKLISNALQNPDLESLEFSFRTDSVLGPDAPEIPDRLTAGQAYYLAHQLGNHILGLSKTKDKSDIQVKLDVIEDEDFNQCVGFKVVVPYVNNNIEKLRKAQNNPLKKSTYSSITRLIARGVAPLTAKNYAKIIDKMNADACKDEYDDFFCYENLFVKKAKNVSGRMNVYTSNGSHIAARKIEPQEETNQDKYILHCHGNYTIYPELIRNFDLRTDATVVLFDYPGYGLSLGEVNTKHDLYDSTISVAKKLIDEGAKYILVDGVSLGGGVAPKVTAKLQQYCRHTGKKVQIEHFNSMSFASTKKFVQGKIREFNLSEEEKAGPNIFRKVLSALFSPLISLVLKLTSWDMDPKKHIQTLSPNSYEVIGAEGDPVMGTYASVEYQLRKQNEIDVLKLEEKLKQLNEKKAALQSLRSIKQCDLKIQSIEHLITQKKHRLLKPWGGSGQIHSTTIDHLIGASDKFTTFIAQAKERKSQTFFKASRPDECSLLGIDIAKNVSSSRENKRSY